MLCNLKNVIADPLFDPISGLMVDPPGATTAAAAAAAGTAAGAGTGHRVDMLEIPGKGRCYVYFARYTYDPLAQSLNDNPQVCSLTQLFVYLLFVKSSGRKLLSFVPPSNSLLSVSDPFG